MFTREHVQSLSGDAVTWYPPLFNAATAFGITTERRGSMWLAQCAHESQGFKRLTENLRYSAAGLRSTWPSRFSVADAKAMQYNEILIAERAYGGRMGNSASGDGYKYRGRGLLMITGRDNYVLCGMAMGTDLLDRPHLLTIPQFAARSAAWFWNYTGLNSLADANDFAGITRRINGGMNGWDDRLAWLQRVGGIA